MPDSVLVRKGTARQAAKIGNQRAGQAWKGKKRPEPKQALAKGACRENAPEGVLEMGRIPDYWVNRYGNIIPCQPRQMRGQGMDF